MTAPAQQEALRTALFALGFDAVRFAQVPAADATDARLRAWIAAGHHADMAWMERTVEKRADPSLVLPEVRSVILLGVNYWSESLRFGGDESGQRPRWARYVLHDDYHDTIKAGLIAAGKRLEADYGQTPESYRYYVDTGPVGERGWATRAGMGFIGKNGMLISREFGNWLFLGAILTQVPFAPDAPLRHSDPGRPAGPGLLCGKCTRCGEACPTGAIREAGVVDARLCVSYQTIENKGVIPRALRRGIGLRLYGCDVCLEVCPWNRFAQEGRRVLLSTRHDLANLPLVELLALTPARFAEVFRRTAVKRLKLGGLLRNACIVAGNCGDTTLVPALATLARDATPMVRAHAVWALRRLGAEGEVADMRAVETDPLVRAEFDGAV